MLDLSDLQLENDNGCEVKLGSISMKTLEANKNSVTSNARADYHCVN